MSFSQKELIGAGLAEAEPGDASPDPRCDPKNFEPPKLEIQDSLCRIEVTDTGSIRTFYSNPTELSHSLDITAQIFVVAGNQDLQDQLASWFQFDPELWSRFVQAHLDGDESLQRQLQQENSGICFFNWGRPVAQSKEQYKIGKRILTKKPYNIGAIGDPLLRSLDHKRYYQWPDRPFRRYDTISSSEDGTVFYHAAKECVSLYSQDVGGLFTGILLVDSIRHHRIFDITFDFWRGGYEFHEDRVPCFLDSFDQVPTPSDKTEGGETFLTKRPLTKFISTLEKYIGAPAPGNSYDLVYIALVHLICDDIAQILEKMNFTFSTIELSLHDNRILQESLPLWRGQLGCCRNINFHQSELLHQLSEGLETAALTATTNNALSQPPPSPSNNSLKDKRDAALARLRTLSTAVERVHRRGESVFQALMSSMSIVSSERAIDEAELVLKLTRLAFFFTPLGLIAAIFGMNINEFEGKLTWWLWLAISLSTSATTYALLYRAEIFIGLSRVPPLIRNISIRRLSRLAVRWLRIIQSILSRMPILLSLLVIIGTLAGLTAATWKLAIIGNLSVGTKASLVIVGLWGPFIQVVVMICFARL